MMLIWIVSISKICSIFESNHAVNIIIIIHIVVTDRGGMRRPDFQYTPMHNQLIDIDIPIPGITIDSINLMKR